MRIRYAAPFRVSAGATARRLVALPVPRRGAYPATRLGDEVVALAWRLGIAAVALQSAAHLVNALADLDLTTVDADIDGGVWTWASLVATFGAALGAALLAVAEPAFRVRWLALAAICAFFSVDDMLYFHERVGGIEVGPVDPPARVTWVAAWLPLLAVSALLLWRMSASMSRAPRSAVRLGLGALGAAIACELASAGIRLVSERGDLLYELEVALEEGLELLGWTIIAAGLLATALSVAAAHSRR